jgi:hypothetical protein
MQLNEAALYRLLPTLFEVDERKPALDLMEMLVKRATIATDTMAMPTQAELDRIGYTPEIAGKVLAVFKDEEVFPGGFAKEMKKSKRVANQAAIT